MKQLIVIILCVLCSCADKKDKTAIKTVNAEPQEVMDKEQGKQINTEAEGENLFYNNDSNLKSFDFSNLPLSKDVDDISNNDTDKYNIAENLRKEILQKENYYKLVNYSLINENKNYRAFTVFGNYDYYTNILLVTTKGDSLINQKVIASIIGDADEMTEISTSFMDSISFKVTTQRKQLTENDNFKTLSSDTKEFKITPSGEINQM